MLLDVGLGVCTAQFGSEHSQGLLFGRLLLKQAPRSSGLKAEPQNCGTSEGWKQTHERQGACGAGHVSETCFHRKNRAVVLAKAQAFLLSKGTCSGSSVRLVTYRRSNKSKSEEKKIKKTILAGLETKRDDTHRHFN